MQHAGRGLFDPGGQAEGLQKPLKIQRPGGVGAVRQANVDGGRGDQDVAAVHEAVIQGQDLGEARLERGPQRLRLAAPAVGARAQQDRRAGKDQGRVLDEDRIRKRLQRFEHLDVQARGIEGGDVRGVFPLEGLEVGVGAAAGAEPLHNTGARASGRKRNRSRRPPYGGCLGWLGRRVARKNRL